MFKFKYQINIVPEEIKPIQIKCEIEYDDPVFEQRMINILEKNHLHIYLSEESDWLSKLMKQQVYLRIYLDNSLRKYDQNITQDFKNKNIILSLKHHHNIEKTKLLFEKKINRAFKEEIQTYQKVQQFLIDRNHVTE